MVFIKYRKWIGAYIKEHTMVQPNPLHTNVMEIPAQFTNITMLILECFRFFFRLGRFPS